jgi:hypothetical protein
MLQIFPDSEVGAKIETDDATFTIKNVIKQVINGKQIIIRLTVEAHDKGTNETAVVTVLHPDWTN